MSHSPTASSHEGGGGVPHLKRDDTLDRDLASTHHGASLSDKEKMASSTDDYKIHFTEEEPGRNTLEKEPVIQTGKDVSAFVVSLRDDGDPPLTIRGFTIGTAVMVINCAVTQVYSAKPVNLQFSNVFIILITWALLLFWQAVMPRESWVSSTGRLRILQPVFRALNPGPIRIKEHVVATIIAGSGLNGDAGPGILATIKLFYGSAITPVMAIFGIFSISMIGVGFVGLLRPLLIYPSEMVYWYTLPMIAVFQMLHQEKAEEKKRIKIFCYLFAGTFLWEPIAMYIAPWLNGISIPCMASMGAPMRIRKHIARLFGGASANQGLGLFSISLDPQYVTPSTFAGFPLKWQSSYWLGTLLGCFFIVSLYYTNAFNAKTYPFMSAALFLENGTVYPINQVFLGSNIEMNQDMYDMYGAPRLTSSALWSFFCQAAAIGALITHVAIFWSKDLWGFVKETRTGTQHDPHYQAMKRYKEVPQWWYMVCLLTAVAAAYMTVGLSNTTLPAWGLTVALLCGMVIAPFSAVIYASYGSAVATNSISKMVAGGIHGGRPVANLWFSVWCHQIVNLLVSLSDYLKLAQYLKIPWRVMFLIQVYGTLLGAYFNWWVISIIIRNKREILLDPEGDNQWSGAYYQSLNAQAVEWALAKYVFAFGSGLHYEIVPMGLLIGACIPPIHWVAKKYIAYVRDLGDLITTPLFIYYLQGLSGGINSYVFSTIALGVYMQVYLRVYRPRIFREYCYLLSAAVDGAAQIMSFLLSFFLLGGIGTKRDFPVWFGNPAGSPDHCVSTRTYN